MIKVSQAENRFRAINAEGSRLFPRYWLDATERAIHVARPNFKNGEFTDGEKYLIASITLAVLKSVKPPLG